MTRFLVARFFSMLVSAWAVLTVVFFLARISGDPLALLIPPDATPQVEAQIKAQYGLDQPLTVQYVRFLAGVLHGDFGRSIRHVEPALQAVLRYMPATIELATASLAISVILGIGLGILAAPRPGSVFELLTMVVALIGQAVPAFWLGLMLMMVFSVHLHWLPVSGRGSLAHLVLPAVVLGTGHMAVFARLSRSSMATELQQDYVRTARGKGLPETVVMLRHALANAAIPLATQIGLTFGRALAGSVITETIFAWPGVGRFALQAVYNRDFPVVQAAVFLVAFIFLLINFLMDVLYAWLDPRIRLA